MYMYNGVNFMICMYKALFIFLHVNDSVIHVHVDVKHCLNLCMLRKYHCCRNKAFHCGVEKRPYHLKTNLVKALV